MNFLRNELVEIFSLYGCFEIVIRCQIDVALESVKFSREKYKLCDFFDILFNSMYELKMLYIFFFSSNFILFDQLRCSIFHHGIIYKCKIFNATQFNFVNTDVAFQVQPSVSIVPRAG